MASKNPVEHSHKFYTAWCAMKRRCKNPVGSSRYYKGVTYIPEWENFINFYDDMFPTWRQGLSLDRINGSEGYSKTNCRWATPKEQANNTKSNRIIEIGGVSKTLANWIDDSGVRPGTVRQRFYVYKWSIEKSLGMEV